MVSTLPGPHDYRSAGIAPALDHVGAGVLEECQPIRVEYRGLDHLLVGTPHWITGPLELPPSGLPEGPTLSTGGNIPRIRRRAIAGERRVSARRVIRGVWLGLAAEAFPLYLPTRGDAGIFYFFSVGSVFFRPLPFFTKRQNPAPRCGRPLPFRRI